MPPKATGGIVMFPQGNTSFGVANIISAAAETSFAEGEHHCAPAHVVLVPDGHLLSSEKKGGKDSPKRTKVLLENSPFGGISIPPELSTFRGRESPLCRRWRHFPRTAGASSHKRPRGTKKSPLEPRERGDFRGSIFTMCGVERNNPLHHLQ